MQLYQLLLPNGKKYIGITSKTAQERFKRHCELRKNKTAIQHAIHKYGKENVVVTILAECDNWELLCLAEMEAIEKFNTIAPNGYNLTLGGEGNAIVGIYGDERITRDKEVISIVKKDYYERNREAISAKKKIHREKNREAISLKNKARYNANKETIKIKYKLYREENKEKIAAQDKSYRDANKELIAIRQKAIREAKKLQRYMLNN